MPPRSDDTPPVPTPRAGDRLRVLVTASQAYPEFERLVLGARHEVVMGFRIFDPLTRLRAPETRAIGQTWADLLAHVLRRGVHVTLYLADFDPVAATDLHRGCWHSMRILAGVREIANAGARLQVHPVLHPARIGVIPALLFRPLIAHKLKKLARQEAGGPDPKRRSHIPGLHSLRAQMDRLILPAFPASHHQKLATADGRYVYIGGLDLDERRFDRPDHDQPAQQTWHDVQLLLDDPALCQAANRHLHSFADVTAARRAPPETPGLLRTLSTRHAGRNLWSMSPRPCRDDIAAALLDHIASARRLIYLETQFLRSRDIAAALARQGKAQPDLRLMIVLPGAPETVAFRSTPALDGRYGDHLQARCLRRLQRIYGDRLLVASPVQPRPPGDQDTGSDRVTLRRAPLIYVHSKVSIVDLDRAVVSSANLNGRSLRWDTEAGVALHDRDEVAQLATGVIGHWLDLPADLGAQNPGALFDRWRQIVTANARTAPVRRTGFLVPYDLDAARRTARPVPGIPEEMV